MSALSRMATNDHKSVRIRKGDTVILSSTPVPGNEKMVANVVNKLYEKGAKVIYSDIADYSCIGTRLPGRTQAHTFAHKTEIFYAGARRIQAP